MANFLCPSVPSSTSVKRSRTKSTKRSSASSRQSGIKRTLLRLSRHSAPATIETSNAVVPRRPQARPSVYSLASLRAWNRMSAISFPEQQGHHRKRSIGASSIMSALDLDRLHTHINSRPRPAPLSSLPRAATDSRLFVTNGLPLSPASVLSPCNPTSPDRETFEEYVTRVFQSEVPPSSITSSQYLTRESGTTLSSGEVSSSSETLYSENKQTRWQDHQVERATFVQFAKPNLVRVPSRSTSRHGRLDCKRPPFRMSSLPGHHAGSDSRQDKELPPLPLPEPLEHNILPYQPYCDPFLAASKDSVQASDASQPIRRLASIAGLDLHLPETQLKGTSVRRKPVPGSSHHNRSAPELGKFELTHDSLPYQMYSGPFHMSQPNRSEHGLTGHKRIFKQDSRTNLKKQQTLAVPANDKEGEWQDMAESELSKPLSDNAMPAILAPRSGARRPVIRKTIARRSTKLSIKVPIKSRRSVYFKPASSRGQARRSASKITAGTMTRAMTNARPSVPWRMVMLENGFPVFPRQQDREVHVDRTPRIIVSDAKSAELEGSHNDKISAKDLVVAPLTNVQDTCSTSSSAKEETLSRIRDRLAVLESTINRTEGEESKQRQLFAEIEDLCDALGG